MDCRLSTVDCRLARVLALALALGGCERKASPPPAALPARSVGTPAAKKQAAPRPDLRPPDARLPDLPRDARFTLRVTTWEHASVEVQTADGKTLTGRTPWTRRLAAGATRITVSRRRHRSKTHTLSLRADAELHTCLDPADQLVRCRRMIPCGMGPKGALLDGDGGKVWVANLHSSPGVQVFDTTSGRQLAGIAPNRRGAVELEYSADGRRVYFSQLATNQVHEVERATYKVLRSFATRGAMSKVIRATPDGKSLLVSNWMSNNVSQIDLGTGAVLRRMPVKTTPRGMYVTPDGKHLYVVTFKEGDLHKIDLATGDKTVIFTGGRTLRHVVGDRKDRTLYISDMYLNCVFVLDRATDKVRRLARTGRKPNTIALSPDDRVLYVSNRGPNKAKGDYRHPGPQWGSVLLLDTATGKVLDAIVGGNQPTALDVSDDGKVLVFSDFLDHRLRIYDVPAYEVLAAGGGGRAESHKRELRKRNYVP